MHRTSAVAALLAALITACLAATAGAHPVDESAPAASPLHLLHLGSGSATTLASLADPATATPAAGRGLELEAPDGPCTEAARNGMPDGEPHNHQDVTQHRNLRCAIEQHAFLPLNEELKARPDVVLGEMDVKADIAAVSVVWPEGGILFFDVSKPAQPKFLSWYRSSNCESAAIANNCGAFVDLSPDGKTAYIALQSLTAVPAPEPGSVGPLPATTPGVEVVDATDPRRPARKQILPVLSQGGVHTARSHVIPDGPGRAPGEYVFAIANNVGGPNQGSGIDISKRGTGGLLQPLSRIEIGETHDTFIQNDPFDGRTYLYIAGGYSKGLLVYDVTNPASPRQVASWNLTPECSRDWYSHTVDVTHRNGKRIVTMPAELFISGNASAADKAKGCGNVNGNGDQPGPLWIIDATDFSKLGQSGDTAEQLKAKSTDTLIASWTNPAQRAAGNLTFSPHNQQIVGDKIYLSDYHGGVFVLDASGAFEGRRERPREMGFVIPNGEPDNRSARPLAGPKTPVAVPRTRGRPSIWDMVYYKGEILAADQVGGFYSLHYQGDPQPPGGVVEGFGSAQVSGCRDSVAPRSRITRRGSRLTRRGVVLRGRTRDLGCGARVHRVRVSIAREVGRRCRFLVRGRFTRPRSCKRTPYVSATGRGAWRLRISRRMPRGRYKVWVRGIDASGNIERKFTRENFLRLRIR